MVYSTCRVDLSRYPGPGRYMSEGNKDDEDVDTSNAAASQDEPCTILYCNCPCHKKKGPAPPAPPPAPPAMGGYCGKGSTQFATWEYDY